MNKLIRSRGLMLLFLIAFLSVNAQTKYKLDLENSKMVVKGTSTIHDWEMPVEQIVSEFEIEENGHVLSDLKSGILSVKVASIKSEHNLMNKKTYEALKEDDFPNIEASIFNAEQLESTGKVMMKLSIAGQTKTVEESFSVKKISNGKLVVNGELDVKMSDFGIKPPVALMGTIKTGNEIKVAYNLEFNKEGQLFGDANNSNK